MKSNGGRFSKNFREMINSLKEIEETRGNIDCSDSIATEIIFQRIQNMGGLKKFIFKTTPLIK